MRTFQNYHKHSYYTNPRVSDSIVSYADYGDRAVELGHSILSSCEHGYQGRYIETFEEAKKRDLKFLFAAEAYWVNDRHEQDKTNCHIWLGAKNESGRQAINRALSEANKTGFYSQARLDRELLLTLPPDDVWVTTACTAYWKYDDIDSFTEELRDHFGKNFFLEVQYHNTDKQRELNRHILELHDQLRIPLIMGCDSHYISATGGQERDDYLLSKGIRYDDEEGWYLDYPDGNTAYERFANQCVLSHQQIVDAIDNTNTFLDVEEYDSPVFNRDIKMPSIYPNEPQEYKDDAYRRLVWNGWDAYKSKVPLEKHELYGAEISKEIDIVTKTKMSDYFIDNYYIIKRGKELGGQLTKTARGSGSSFLTNKLLGFTEVDRLAAKVKLYPERFMSTERILETKSLPDQPAKKGAGYPTP